VGELSTALAMPARIEFGELMPRGHMGRADLHAPSVYLASLSEGSRRAMKGALQIIADIVSSGRCDWQTLPWGELRFQHTQAIRTSLAEKFAVGYARKILSALRGCLKAAWRLGQIPTDEYQRAVDIEPIRGSRQLKGRQIKTRELDKLFEVCEKDKTLFGIRDTAILSMLFGGGLRRREMATFQLEDYDEEGGEVKVAKGKGNKERTTYAGRDTRDAMDDYLKVRGRDAGPMFLPIRSGRARKDGTKPTARFEMRQMNDQAIWDIIQKRVAQAGIDSLSPHDFRRSMISELIDLGVDLSTIQKIVGHANINTTAGYDRRPERAKKAAAELLRHRGGKGNAIRRR
jgi:site-specific recombinase XerD